ncbi:MAG: CmcJ/NvfI family oxidoreductase [Candidatus Binatia bacterium]
MRNDTMQGLNHVDTSLYYLDDMAEKPVTYMYKPPSGVPERTGRYIRHPVSVYDGRSILPQISLDTHGFTLTRHETGVANFYDENEVRTVYYPEVERLVKEVTGAVKVVVFDHNVRFAPMAQRGENGAREPVRIAHNDYTLRSGPQRVRDLLDADEAEERLQHRFAEINVWRPIRGPVQATPLAVCDARSLTPQDFVTMDLKYRDRTGEVYVVTFNPRHRWFYFPHMQANEVLFLKCYDSMDDGRARFTAHTAFDDPSTPPDAPARESIEARTLVFFPPA